MVAGGFKLFTAVALISFVLNLLVDNPYTHRFVRQKLDKILENTTEIALEFSAIKVSVMPPGVTLYAVKIYPRATPKFEWLSAVKLKAQVSLWAAILGDFRLSVVEANQLSVVWPMPFDFPGFLKSDDGEKNQPAAPESPMTWPPDFDLPLDRLVLVNSNVSVDIPIADQVPEPVETLYMTAAGISLDLAFRSWEKIKGSIKIDSFDLAIDSSVIVDDIMVQ